MNAYEMHVRVIPPMYTQKAGLSLVATAKDKPHGPLTTVLGGMRWCVMAPPNGTRFTAG